MSLRTINDYGLFQALFSGYLATDQAKDSADDDIYYYGFQNKAGEWYIMKEDRSVSGVATTSTWTYKKGDSDYATNWTGREALTYTRPAVAFI